MKKLLKKLNKRSDREESKPVKAENPSLGSSRAVTLPRPEKFGLFPLHEPSPGANHHHRPFPINIIAVHGLSGDAYSTWTHPNGTLWLRDLLPDFLPGCRVYTYGYPSQVAFSTSYADVSVYARRLLNSIRGLWEEWPKGSRSIIFVCHSLGGIVFKQALVYAHEDDIAVLKSISGVVFLGTPQRGSDVANIGAIAGRVINACAMVASAGLQNRIVRRDLLDNLSFDSKALQDLSISVRNRLLDMDVVSFYETKPLSPFSCLIVEQNSSILAIPGEDPVPLYEDHRSMCRFAGETESYRAVSQAIRRIALAVKDKTEARKEHPDERSSLHSSLRSFTDFERTCVALFSAFSIEDYRRSLRQPATGTCHWILRHPVFVSWLERADSALLWLSGYPGCGKTVLSLFLAGHFEACQSPLAPKTVLVYFCDDRIARQKDANGILLGLIFQIICRHRSLIRHVKRAFETRGPNMVQSFSALWGVFLDAVSDPKCGATHIIIDALDECEPASRRKLLEFIYAFIHHSGGDTGTKQRVKFILTSRPSTVELETIAEQVADHRISIDENQEGYLDGLKEFIQQRVDEISQKWKLPQDTKTSLGKSLVSQAGGTFLWVHMVLAWLESRLLLSKNAVRDLLTTIPPNLETTYMGLLSSIPPDHHFAASKLLLLVLGSSRPLSLEELNIAFTVQERHRTLEDVASDSQTAMQHTIQGVLGPLVRTSDSKVSLVHKSVKDFLLQRRQMDNAPPVMRELTPISAALSISGACIRYLLLEDFSRDLFSSDDESPLESPASSHGPAECCASSPTGSCSRQSSWDEDADEWGMAGLFKEPDVLLANACQLLAETYAFYRYASLNWTQHYAVCEASAPAGLRDAATSLLDITTPRGGNWWRFFTTDPEHKTRSDIPSRPSRLTLAAFFGLSDAVNAELLRVGHQTELLRATTDEALFWASHGGHSSIIETLLLAGADPNAQGLDGHTALTIASRNGHLGCVVALLRDARTNVNLRGEKGRTALSLACSNQHPDIVQTLLATAHCNAAVQDDSGATALHWACRMTENKPAMAALLRHGTVSPNHRDKHGRTALFWAAGHGIKTAVEALLDLPAVDANLADVHGRSPLSWAAGNGRASTVRLLVRSDKVDKASVDKGGRNSFSWAAGGGHADVLRVLVENGCPGVDEPDVDRWAPLAWATHHSSPRAADVLLATRAVDLERRDKGGWTALAWAVRYGHIHVVRSLLRAGADPLAASNSGATPLSLSQEPGWELIRDELLHYTEGKGRAEE